MSLAHHSAHPRLIADLVRSGVVRSEPVKAAFTDTPREIFLPRIPAEMAYSDEPIPTHRGNDGVPISSSSQPSAMALMLEQLDVQPGHRVLEIGAGTGYNAALLAHLAGPGGSVVTVDIDEEIVDEARSHLGRLIAEEPQGLRAPITTLVADGGVGYPAGAPYDRIILTVGAWDIAPAWIEQLAPDGRLLLPLWFSGVQRTITFARPVSEQLGTGPLSASATVAPALVNVSVTACGFMRLRGAFAGPEGYVSLSVDDGLKATVSMTWDRETAADRGLVAIRLREPGGRVPSPVRLRERDLWGDAGLWLALADARYVGLTEERSRDDALGYLAPVVRFGSNGFTLGLLGDDGSLALLVPDTPVEQSGEDARACSIQSYGPSGMTLANDLVAHLTEWDRLDRPGDDRLRIAVYPIDQLIDIPGTLVVPKRWHRYVIWL